MFIETLCPQQMLVHKGGQTNNVQLITGMGSAEMSHLYNCSVKIFKGHCRYFTTNNKKMKFPLKMGGGGRGGLCGWM